MVGNGISEPSRPVISKILFSYTFGHQGAQKRSQQGGALKIRWNSGLKTGWSRGVVFFVWSINFVQVAQQKQKEDYSGGTNSMRIISCISPTEHQLSEDKIGQVKHQIHLHKEWWCRAIPYDVKDLPYTRYIQEACRN